MRRADFIENELPLLCVRLQELSGTKGREYAGEEELLLNMKEQAIECGVRPETVLHIFMTKHLRAISTYVRDTQAGNKRALSEPIEGRIEDAILYLALLRVMVRESKQ
jgi:hypothetical protein